MRTENVPKQSILLIELDYDVDYLTREISALEDRCWELEQVNDFAKYEECYLMEQLSEHAYQIGPFVNTKWEDDARDQADLSPDVEWINSVLKDEDRLAFFGKKRLDSDYDETVFELKNLYKKRAKLMRRIRNVVKNWSSDATPLTPEEVKFYTRA